jgi:acetyl-CoA synthetase
VLQTSASNHFPAVAPQMAEDLYWHRRWVPDHHRYNFDMRKGPISIEWFRGAKTNMCADAL